MKREINLFNIFLAKHFLARYPIVPIKNLGSSIYNEQTLGTHDFGTP